MSSDAASKPQAPRPKRTFTVTVGLSTVISTILVVSAGFVAMFALGVLLGRGYDPEAGIPELERMMPQPGRPAAPIVISDSDADAAPPPRPEDGILGQGDLAYPDSLRTPQPAPRPREPQPARPPAAQTATQTTGQQTKPPAKPPAAQTAGQPPKQEQAKPARQQPAGSNATGAPGLTPLTMTGTAPVRTASQAQGQVQSQPQSGDQRVYNYVYQTAAYKDQASSDRFAAKLKSAGLNARTQQSADNGVTWYRVMVDFRGKPDDTDALRAKLQSLGVGKPIMKSKVAAQ